MTNRPFPDLWKRSEIRHKLEDAAAKAANGKPRGYLLSEWDMREAEALIVGGALCVPYNSSAKIHEIEHVQPGRPLNNPKERILPREGGPQPPASPCRPEQPPDVPGEWGRFRNDARTAWFLQQEYGRWWENTRYDDVDLAIAWECSLFGENNHL